MYKQRPITISGTSVSLHAWEHRPKEEKYDYSQQLSFVDQTVKDMFKSSEIVPIFIQGQTGSGKSTLAQVLKANGSNIEIIDVLIEHQNGNKTPSKLISDSSKTYIVDEAGFGDMEIITNAEKHAKSGGLIIVLIQDIRDVGGQEVIEFNVKPKYLKLEKSKISKLNLAEFA